MSYWPSLSPNVDVFDFFVITSVSIFSKQQKYWNNVIHVVQGCTDTHSNHFCSLLLILYIKLVRDYFWLFNLSFLILAKFGRNQVRKKDILIGWKPYYLIVIFFGSEGHEFLKKAWKPYYSAELGYVHCTGEYFTNNFCQGHCQIFTKTSILMQNCIEDDVVKRNWQNM